MRLRMELRRVSTDTCRIDKSSSDETKEISMQSVEVIDPVKDERWTDFIKVHPLAEFCHHPGWKTVLENSFPHVHGYYFVLIDDNTIQAALPIFTVKSWIIGDRLVSIPYATLFDPLISTNDQFNTLFTHVKEFARNQGIKRIELDVFATSSLVQSDHLAMSSFYVMHCLKLSSDPEKLKKTFDRTCVVQKISRAMKSGLTLRAAESEADVDEFYRLYSMTRKRVGLPPQPIVFFRQLWKTFYPLGTLQILIATKESHALAALLLLKHGKRTSAEYIGYDWNYLNLNPHHFLFWHAIKAACEGGFEVFDFGRTAPTNIGLMDFKKRWGTIPVELPQCYYPAESSGKNVLVENPIKYRIVRGVCRHSPEFVYKGVASFLYRHMG